MAVVILKSWNEGMQKVALSMLQFELLKISLKESKENVDYLLEGNEVALKINDHDLAKTFANKASELGVNCQLID